MQELDIRHFVLSHIIWVVLVAAGVVGFHYWQQEHDAKLLSEQQEKVSEQTIAGLQTQISRNNQQIETLQQSMKQVSDAAAKQVQVIVKQQEAVKTPEQAIASISEVANRDVDARTVAGEADRASVLAMPLYQNLSDCRIAQLNLSACTTNLATETTIAATNADSEKKQEAIVAQKQLEIDALKVKPSFWSRLKADAKKIGIGIGVGIALGARL